MLARFITKIHPSWCFYGAIWGIIVGIAWGMITEQVVATSFLWLICIIILFSFSLYRPCRLAVIIAFLAGLILGNFCTSSHLSGKLVAHQYLNQTVLISGDLVDDPDTSKGTASLRLRNLQLHDPSTPVENLWKTSSQPVENSSAHPSVALPGTLYVTLSKSHDLGRSDRVLLEGKLGEGFGTFVGKMSRPQLLAISRSDPGDIFAQFKRWFSDRVKHFLPSPQVDLGLGYLMGLKSGLPNEFSDALQAVGMTHVVVASGAHLAILIAAAKQIFGKISKFAGLLFSLLMILAFVLIVGFTPSMTRAALVASLSLVMGYIGRKFTPLRLISFVAALTLLIDPANLLNLGWQLSFASFFGILVLGPRLQKAFYGGKTPPWLASMLLTSISTSLICAPILIYNFGTLSLLSLLANLIILPTLPYVMLGMMLVGVVGGLPLLGSLVATPTLWLLNLHIWLVNFLSEKTMFILEFPESFAWIYLLYLPILLFLVYPSLRRRFRPTARSPEPAANIA